MKRSSVVLLVACTIGLLFLPQMPDCVMANSPKVGRVVESATGRGIPNALVIAAAKFHSGPIIHGSRLSTPYRLITHTDAAGNFSIPNTWIHFALGMPGTGPREQWFVTVLKPGLILEGDDAAASALDAGHSNAVPDSLAFSPAAVWLGPTVRLEPLRLKPFTHTLRTSAIYYNHVAAVGGFAVGDPDDEAAIRRTGREFFESEVCRPNGSEMIDFEAAATIVGFGDDPSASILALKAAMHEQWDPSVSATAADVCSALKAGSAHG